MESVWTQSVRLSHFEELKGNADTDVLIIGGGMAGILCAYFLQKSGIDYILAEGRTICAGVTKNTTAKITSQHGLIYDRLLKSAGIERAKAYLSANEQSVEKYFELCRDIDCDFHERDSYVYSMNNAGKLEKEADALHRLGFGAELCETEELPFQTAGAVRFRHQAEFNPLKFISVIAEGLNIYENTFVREIAENTVLTDNGRITFKRLIFATHFPIDNRHGMYFLKMYQHRSYVIALERAAKLEGMYVDEAKKGMSFRSYKDLLLIGGGDHKTGKKGGNWQELREFSWEHYPYSVERYCWATQDCMTLDGIPYIGRYSKNTPDRYVASGFNKWGMTSSMTAALLLTDMLMGKENGYEEVFSPSRSMMKKQLIINGFEAVKNICTISGKRCPHMGCALKWNSQERSWDCPCHGSRFDEKGSLLDNPSNADKHF